MSDLASAYHYCRRYAELHYENFPVASLFIPRKSRGYVAAIYAFARIADDYADEGEGGQAERLRNLDLWERSLEQAIAGSPDHPVMAAIADTIRSTGIEQKLLTDLLSAFRQDVTQQRYATFHEVLDYCSRSANPIGRMVLSVFGEATMQNSALSDEICTALQLTNFWQDVSIDIKKPRIYIPLEDLERFGYNERDLYARNAPERFRALMQFQVERTEEMFRKGKSLPARVPVLRRELQFTWWGGMTILSKIRHIDYDVLRTRPRITPGDIPLLLARVFFAR
jgi:squalene synthase HpnC